MAMVHELASGLSRASEAHEIDCAVQACFQQTKKDVTGNTALFLCSFKGQPKLFFGESIHEAELLLLGQAY